MRRSSPLLRLLLGALIVCGACNPTIQHSGTSGAPSVDDASAFTSASGDDGGWGDDGDDASDPSWDASTMRSEDAGGPVAPGDDGSADATPPVDAGVDGECTQTLGAGDLVIDELMIESVAGAGDDGEWLEVASTAGCAIDLRGLHGECTVGAKVDTFDVVDDAWILPGGTFIVADSDDPAVNHYLPGLVLTWSGQPGDVLRNLGGTVTLSVEDVLVVSLTWPSMKLAVGTTVELPADCPAGDADELGVWEPATASWFPGFHGTPNSPNTDVQCP